MGSFCDYLENKILDHILGKTAFTMPTVYVGLSTADPLDNGSGLAEPVDGSYARVATVGATWDAANAGATANAQAITFPKATGGGWGTVTHFVLFDAATAGNHLAHGQLSVSKTIGANDTPSFDVGSLTLTLD